MKWLGHILNYCSRGYVKRLSNEYLPKVEEALKDAETIDMHFPEFAKEISKLCEVNGIKNPPKFYCSNDLPTQTILHILTPPSATPALDAVLIGKISMQVLLERGEKKALGVMAHELGHLLRRDLIFPGAALGRSFRIDLSGQNKLMEHSTDAIGAHLMYRYSGGSKQPGMDAVRLVNDIRAEALENLERHGGKKGKAIGRILDAYETLHYGTPAQRLDSVRRALRHDFDKQAKHLDRLIAERNASGLGTEITR